MATQMFNYGYYEAPQLNLATFSTQPVAKSTTITEAQENVPPEEERGNIGTIAAIENAYPLKPEPTTSYARNYFVEGSSKAFRKRLIVDKLNEVATMLSLLKGHSGQSESLVITARILGHLNACWEIIDSSDRDIALTISSLQALFEGEFWKDFKDSFIEELVGILAHYSESDTEDNYRRISSLMASGGINILPRVPINDK